MELLALGVANLGAAVTGGVSRSVVKKVLVWAGVAELMYETLGRGNS
jgi:hypothetical protein